MSADTTVATDAESIASATKYVRQLIKDGTLAAQWHASDEKIFTAAIQLFSERGFSGTSTRMIANQAGMSPGALYSHYDSKEDILYRILRLVHEGMLRQMQVTAAAEREHKARLRALVMTHVQYHAEMFVATRVANYELRWLDPERSGEILQLRRLIESVIRDALLLAQADGVIKVDDLQLATIMVLSLGIDVARWYRPSGGIDHQALATFYTDHVLKMFAV